MTCVFDRDDIIFQVVVNHEEQYSLRPDYKAIPNGWQARPEAELPAQYQRGMGRHAPVEPAPENDHRRTSVRRAL
ncbi:hypothetical protein ABIA58_002482 [Pseudomonas frederiksbergensis]